MAIFVALASQPNATLGQKVATAFPGEHYAVNDQQWLIWADKPVVEVGADLDVSTGNQGHVAIFRIASPYWGWHDKALWEWISLKETKG